MFGSSWRAIGVLEGKVEGLQRDQLVARADRRVLEDDVRELLAWKAEHLEHHSSSAAGERDARRARERIERGALLIGGTLLGFVLTAAGRALGWL